MLIEPTSVQPNSNWFVKTLPMLPQLLSLLQGIHAFKHDWETTDLSKYPKQYLLQMSYIAA
jgi:hypothetical protein